MINKSFYFNDKHIWVDFDINGVSKIDEKYKPEDDKKTNEENKFIIGDKTHLNINYNLDNRRQTYEFKRISNTPERKRENSLHMPSVDQGKD